MSSETMRCGIQPPWEEVGDTGWASTTKDLALYNQERLRPGTLVEQHPLEMLYLDAILGHITPQIPQDVSMDWYENLLTDGPGQCDPLFPWLAESVSIDKMTWFLRQEGAGEAGFGDLVAMVSIRMSNRAKLEMARNYWDEMGRGEERGMHDLLLRNLLRAMDITPPTPSETVMEALQLGNIMVGLCSHRRYAYQALGALGVIEMTAPGRVGQVDRGLKRLGIASLDRQYFTLHATLDVKHSREWNREVIEPLFAEHGRAMAEGAYLRLWAGEQCFRRYRRELWGTGVESGC